MLNTIPTFSLFTSNFKMGVTSLIDTTFDKINFLRALKLMPKNKKIHARWERQMEKNLIVKNNISDCIVYIICYCIVYNMLLNRKIITDINR